VGASPFAHELRALLIVNGFRGTSVYPVPVDAIHVTSYFADAFASVWKTPALTETVLKTRAVPRNRRLQDAIDRLVGRGLFIPTAISYSATPTGARLAASYSINRDLANRALEVVYADEEWRAQLDLTREVAIGIASLGHDRINQTVLADASYSDPLLDFNTVVDLGPDDGEQSKTADANERLAAVALRTLGQTLTPSELTAFYIRHLYPFTEVPA